MTDDPRPSPEILLEKIRKDSRGRLKIFLGMCPGVGKTYAMLLAAQQRQEEEGIRVLVGYVETHGRIETTAVAAGLPRVPRRVVRYRDSGFEEMDTDAILAAKPALVLVDELAHSNVTGGRHPKRWQDVVEILEAGIDVYTTLNVQHIESYRDVVAQITGAPAHEAVPDSLIDLADEIELIDISPAELRKRLEDGKVYLGERAVAASAGFFRDGNLRALREIALRIAAEKADSELRDFLSERRIAGPWKAGERYLVAVGPSPFSGYLIRWTRRLCALTHGTWMAVYIDSGRSYSVEERERLDKNLALARSLGAEVLAVMGTNVARTLIRVARENNATQIVVGRPLSNPVIDLLRGGSLVDKLIRGSGEIDISVVRAEKSPPRQPFRLSAPRVARFFREIGIGALMVLGTTLFGLILNPYLGYTSVGLIYLLAILLAAFVLSRWAILFTAALTALAWDFLFIQPYYTFYISGAHDVILFATYFVLALVMGSFTSQLRARESAEHRREEQATALYRFSRAVVESPSLREGIARGLEHIDRIFDAESSVLAGRTEDALDLVAGKPPEDSERAVAAWAFGKKQPAGRYTNTLPQSAGMYLPLQTGGEYVGVLGLRLKRALTLTERELIESFASQIALLIERERLLGDAERARIDEKSARLQKTLLDSVSHEFRTPLAVISGAAEALEKNPADTRALTAEIRIAGERLHRVVGNLLDITRIETGAIHPKAEWCDLEEIVSGAVARVGGELGGRRVDIQISPEAAVVRTDSGLVEEMLANLLRNAAQAGGRGAIRVTAAHRNSQLKLSVLDEGPGLGDGARVFEKFYRGENSQASGLGLGLSIVKGFAEALGGSVSAANRTDVPHGAAFEILLPAPARSAEALLPAQ